MTYKSHMRGQGSFFGVSLHCWDVPAPHMIQGRSLHIPASQQGRREGDRRAWPGRGIYHFLDYVLLRPRCGGRRVKILLPEPWSGWLCFWCRHLFYLLFLVDFQISSCMGTLLTENIVSCISFLELYMLLWSFTFLCINLGILLKWHDTIQFITRTVTLKIVLSDGLLSSSSQPSYNIPGHSSSWISSLGLQSKDIT